MLVIDPGWGGLKVEAGRRECATVAHCQACARGWQSPTGIVGIGVFGLKVKVGLRTLFGDDGVVGEVLVADFGKFSIADFPVGVGEVVPTELPACEDGAGGGGLGEEVELGEGGGAVDGGFVEADGGGLDAVGFEAGGDFVFGGGGIGDVEGGGVEVGREVGEDAIDVPVLRGVGEAGVGVVETFGGGVDGEGEEGPDEGEGGEGEGGGAEAAVLAGGAEVEEEGGDGEGEDPVGPVVFEEEGGDGGGEGGGGAEEGEWGHGVVLVWVRCC